MTFPGDGRMLLLLAVWTGEGIEVRGADLYLTLSDGGASPVRPEALDDLESLGWVEITEAGVGVTDKGVYSLNKWVEARARRQGHHGKIVLKSARVGAAEGD